MRYGSEEKAVTGSRRIQQNRQMLWISQKEEYRVS